ncbi:MAG: DUF4167 domain-containing protein [Hyphomicrobium sp.]
MRQGQQNRRGRGRNNNNNNNSNNRRSQNPLTRSFESAGPDVKLRGTPSHIAEKYISLARDALSSGDPVLAENYLQHAEHYNRIILSFREQQVSQGGDPYQNGMARTHSLGSPDGEGDDFGDEDGDDMSAQGQPGAVQADAPQPNVQPPQQRFENRPQRHDNQQRGDNRHNQNNRFDRNDRGDRPDRPDRPDRQDRFGGEPRGFRDDRGNQGGNGQSFDGNGGYRRRDRFGGPNSAQGYAQQGAPRDPADGGSQPPQNGFERAAAPLVSQSASQPAASGGAPEQDQPAFLRRPVRRPRRDDGDAPAPAAQTEGEGQD